MAPVWVIDEVGDRLAIVRFATVKGEKYKYSYMGAKVFSIPVKQFEKEGWVRAERSDVLEPFIDDMKHTGLWKDGGKDVCSVMFRDSESLWFWEMGEGKLYRCIGEVPGVYGGYLTVIYSYVEGNRIRFPTFEAECRVCSYEPFKDKRVFRKLDQKKGMGWVDSFETWIRSMDIWLKDTEYGMRA